MSEYFYLSTNYCSPTCPWLCLCYVLRFRFLWKYKSKFNPSPHSCPFHTLIIKNSHSLIVTQFCWDRSFFNTIRQIRHLLRVAFTTWKSFLHDLSESCPEMKEPMRMPKKKTEEVNGFFHWSSHTRSHWKHTHKQYLSQIHTRTLLRKL